MSGLNAILFTIFGSLYSAVIFAAIGVAIYLVIVATGYLSVGWMKQHRFVSYDEEEMPAGFRERRRQVGEDRRHDSRRNEDRRHGDRRRNYRYSADSRDHQADGGKE